MIESHFLAVAVSPLAPLTEAWLFFLMVILLTAASEQERRSLDALALHTENGRKHSSVQ